MDPSTDMSASLSEERDRIRRQVEELEQNLSVTQNELDLLSSETDDSSDGEDVEEEVETAGLGLLVQRQKIQEEIQDLEDMLGRHSPIVISDGDTSSSSDESDLGLSPSVDSCLQLNLVYQQVVQDILDQLETLLNQNQRQQRELVTQMSGPIKEPSRRQPSRSSYQHPVKKYLGRFLKPYFKDKLTGLGPPANQEAKQRALRMAGYLDDNKLKPKRWESWQKNLLIHSVARDTLKRLIQPKLSRVEYLTQKLSSVEEAGRQQLREQMDGLEREIDLLREKKEEELIGDRYDEHDWQKISNIDFEGIKGAEDIRVFWQNFLHPSINKSSWSKEEVQQLKEVSRRHEERHWESIAQELGTGRTAFMCLQMFQRFVSVSLKRKIWTPEEDVLLRELVDKMRIGNFIPYTQMSYFMEGRDPGQLIYRWNQVLDPSLKKGPWTKEEDQLLLNAVARHGEKSWWKVRLEVPGRTDGGCRDRYLDCLRGGLRRGAFDGQERELLHRLVEKHGVGRWAKIAAEIPHRLDSQCMREWRKLSQPSSQGKKREKRPRKAAGEKKKRGAEAKRTIRRRLVRVKEEELTDEEEEELLIPYMDSDEEEEKTAKEERIEEEAEEEVEYAIPPLQEWLPAEKLASDSLSFRPVALPPSSDPQDGKPVRSTIVGKSGRSVVIGPRPRELRWEERHSKSAMMMVSADQLRTHLSRRGARQRGGAGGSKGSEKGMEYELQAAVTPWIGNLLIASSTRRTLADVLREGCERSGVTSTSVFLLLLHAMNVDVIGCREMIGRRQNKAAPLTPPPDTKTRDSRTVAGALQQRRARRQQQGVEQERRRLMLLHLQQLLQVEQVEKQLLQVEQVEKPRLLQAEQVEKQLLQVEQVEKPRLLQAEQVEKQLLQVEKPRLLQVEQVEKQLLQVEQVEKPRLLQAEQVEKQLLQVEQLEKQLLQLEQVEKPRLLLQAEQVEKQLLQVEQVEKQLLQLEQVEQVEKPRLLLQVAPRQVVFVPQVRDASCIQVKAPTTAALAPPPPHRLAVASISTRKPTRGGEPRHEEDQEPRQTDGSQITQAEAVQTASWSSVSSQTAEPSSSAHRVVEPPFTVAVPYREHNYMLSSKPRSAPKRQSRGRKRQRGEEPQEKAGGGAAVRQDEKRLRRPSLKARAVQEAVQAQRQSRGRKRQRGEEPQEKAGGGAAERQDEKRLRRPSLKARAVQEAVQAQAEAKKRSSSSPWRRSKDGVGAQPLPQPPPPPQAQAPPTALPLFPGQTMWVMTQTGLVQMAFVSPLAPPPHRSNLSIPYQPPPALAPPTCLTKPRPPLALSRSSSQPHPEGNLPYKGGVVAAKAPPLRKEGLQFDSSLMFLEPQEAVRDWLSGRGGVPGARGSLPYLPPSASTLSALSALLRAKKCLTQASLQLLSEGNKPRHPSPTQPSSTHPSPTQPGPTQPSTTQPPPDLPDSTSDLRRPAEKPAASVSADQEHQEVEERVRAVRQLVAERFSTNPAYQLLKARFLSCFTVPALLATMQPIKEEELSCSSRQEEEEEKKIQEPGRRRRTARSRLLSGSSAAPANHFSGISNTSRPTPDQAGPLETGPEQPSPDQ
ncbi:snRNA-activating protein complex subunit 4 isoform 1-T1 [Odontesthes bonariensis]|uniref:snRNA-activating protein complex subunit 4 isoform X2 n=1 Tax=Odontesthes bonariensis TaxID=219752 RepID=UPI003F583D89